MFHLSDHGVRTAAVLAALIATATGLALDPFAYLPDLFARLSDHPRNRLAGLPPKRWQAARHPSASC